jgi:hypothetical protein
MNHKIGRLIFGFGVGLLVAVFALKWISDPAPRAERAVQETVAVAARQILKETLGLDGLEMVDPVEPDRKVGKSYIFRRNDGWEVSGYYRRSDGDRWHPFLMVLDDSVALMSLKVRDPELIDRAQSEALLEAIP